MQTLTLGYPRIGAQRELKKGMENFWSNKINEQELNDIAHAVKLENWKLQKENNIDLISSNDFSFYDQVLDLIQTFNCIPKRFHSLQKELTSKELYYSLARGYQKNNIEVKAMEMTKWFDTNYHYIVPEWYATTQFNLNENPKIVEEYKEAKAKGYPTKPVLIGPITFLKLGKEKENNFSKLDLLKGLLPAYIQLLQKLQTEGVSLIQIDEPYLSLDSDEETQNAIKEVYQHIAKEVPELKILLTSYFDCYGENLETVLKLPIDTLHLDLVRCGEQAKDIFKLHSKDSQLNFSLGIVDGRNIWKNDYQKSITTINNFMHQYGPERIKIATSCSLLHCPYDIDLENKGSKLDKEVKEWLSFSKQKLQELNDLKNLITSQDYKKENVYIDNQKILQKRKDSDRVHQNNIKQRVDTLKDSDALRSNPYKYRKVVQQQTLNLPLLPTTTIGSLPQTKEIRKERNAFKKGTISEEKYNQFLESKIKEAIEFQEEIDIDVLVHGEFERNDMVEYFGEKLNGITFSNFGWVQSYGSRCVKPPIIYGDVSRPKPMTLDWTNFAQKQTKRPIKGMLTGPVTILHWSFVRDDQPKKVTCQQISLAIRDEVIDLEKAGIKVIQIDEPALREGLPLRKEQWNEYLTWAVNCFKIAANGVKDQTQIHTHMCYSQFNDIIKNIADLDADVITIECSRSQMNLLDAFSTFNYPNEIGPGVYDIHSPNVPSRYDILDFIDKAKKKIAIEQLWINPDCGLKTRNWKEVKLSLEVMVQSAKKARELFGEQVY